MSAAVTPCPLARFKYTLISGKNSPCCFICTWLAAVKSCGMFQALPLTSDCAFSRDTFVSTHWPLYAAANRLLSHSFALFQENLENNNAFISRLNSAVFMVIVVNYLNLSECWQSLQTQVPANPRVFPLVFFCCVLFFLLVIPASLQWDTVGTLLVCHGISEGTRNRTVWTEVWQFCGPVVHVTRLNKPSLRHTRARACTHAHTHTIPLLGQSSTTAYRCLQAIRHPHATLQRGSCRGYVRTFCAVGMVELTPSLNPA